MSNDLNDQKYPNSFWVWNVFRVHAYKKKQTNNVIRTSLLCSKSFLRSFYSTYFYTADIVYLFQNYIMYIIQNP